MPLARRTRTVLRTVLAPLLVAAAAALPSGSASAAAVSCDAAGLSVTSLGGPNFYIDGSNPVQFRSGYTGYRITNSSGAALGDVWAQLSSFTGGSLALASGQPAAQRVGDLTSGRGEARFWYLTASALSSTAQNHTITLYTHNPALPNAVPLCTTSGGFSSVQSTIGANANKVDTITVTGGAPSLGAQFTVVVTGHTGTVGSGIANDPESFWMTPSVQEAWPAGAFRLLTTKLTIAPDGSSAARDYVDTLRVAGIGGGDRPYTARYTFQAVGPTGTSTAVKPVQEIASGTQVKHTDGYPASIPAIPSPVNDLSLTAGAEAAQLPLGGGTTTLTGSVSGTGGAELDALTLTLPDGAEVVPGTATWGETALPDPVATSGGLVFPGPFVVGTGSLAVDVEYDGTPGIRTATLVGTIGTTTIGATTGSATPAHVGVDVDHAPTAQDTASATQPGTPVQVNLATLSNDVDGDPLAFTVPQPVHGQVDLAGSTLTYTPADGFQGDDPITWTVDDGRGGTASATLTVTADPEAVPPVVLASQALTFTQPDDLVAGDDETLTATSDARLPVSFRSTTPRVCSVTEDVLTAVAAGSCIVVAEQAGSDTVATAEPVSRTLTVSDPPPPVVAPVDPPVTDPQPPVVPPVDPPVVAPPAAASQTISFTAPDTLLGTAPYALAATASSGLPVGLAVTDGPCVVQGATLTAARAASCTVEATQSGDAGNAPAVPVRRTVTFVDPADDSARTDGATPVTVDVLANDPRGVRLDAVTAPTHGTATIVDGRVRYQPGDDLRGADAFGYTVSRDGRTAQATVTVTVANQRPVARGGALTQWAGTVVRRDLHAWDPNADAMTFTATADDSRVESTVRDGVLVLRAAPGASGDVAVAVTVSDDAGGSRTVVVHDRVRPLAPASVGRRLSAGGTTVDWDRAPTSGASYDVLVDGAVVCHTTATRCAVDTVLGPQRHVVVRTVGRDATVSTRTPAPLTGHGEVLVRTVYFAPNSAALTAADRRTLDAAIRIVHRDGFPTANLDGYTDADGGLAFNLALSHRRTRAVAAYLHRRGGLGNVQTWHGETDPVASNAAASGKARNRRVEVLVRY